MKTLFSVFLFSFCIATAGLAQTFIPIWQGVTMPNSRGMNICDSISNERIVQVGTPALYAFRPSVAENTGTAVIIIPGGGYVRLAHEVSGFALAKWFNTIGITAFVLQHRFPGSADVITSYQAPLQDAQRAMRYVRAHAAEYGIHPQRIGVMGSSAGGHLSASVSTITHDWAQVGDSLDSYSFRPDFAILVSPVISMNDSITHRGTRNNLLGEKKDNPLLLHTFSLDHQVSSQTPPTLLIHASNDRSVSPLNSVAYYQALLSHGVKQSSLHIFPFGGHAISLRRQPGSTAQWPIIAEAWMQEVGVLEPLTLKQR